MLDEERAKMLALLDMGLERYIAVQVSNPIDFRAKAHALRQKHPQYAKLRFPINPNNPSEVYIIHERARTNGNAGGAPAEDALRQVPPDVPEPVDALEGGPPAD